MSTACGLEAPDAGKGSKAHGLLCALQPQVHVFTLRCSSGGFSTSAFAPCFKVQCSKLFAKVGGSGMEEAGCVGCVLAGVLMLGRPAVSP